MTMKCITNAFLFLVLLFVSLFLAGIDVFADSWEKEKLWSFSFNNCTVPEALGQIAKDTKKEICLKGETDNKVGLSYENQSLKEIIKDILRNENYILAMFPGNEGIGTVKVWLLGKGRHDANNASTAFSRSNKETLRNNKRHESSAALEKMHSRKSKGTEPSFRSTEALAPPEPEKRLDIEPPPMPPGLPMPGK